MKEIKKALTFRASSIGDCLMGKYLLENIHTQFPEARLGIVVANRGAMIRDLFATYPWLEVIEVNRRDIHGLWQLLRDFHSSDLVVTQYAGKPGGRFGMGSKLMARLLARHGGMVGFTDASSLNKFLYSILVPFSPNISPAEHERRALLASNLPLLNPWPTLMFNKNETVLSRFSLTTQKYIIVHFFAGNKGRSLSPEKSRELLMKLHKNYPDIQLVVSGTKDDRKTALSIVGDVPATVIAGEASLQELMQLIAESVGAVSVDTGVAHITAQLGVPLIVLSTCLGPNWWNAEQYGVSAPIQRFSRPDICATGHVSKDYPDCINLVDIDKIAHSIKI